MSRTNEKTDTEWSELRRRMVASQLAARGIDDLRVLEAMGEVPRERFVPAESADWAYEDCALPIGYGQTISQPFTVAYMCQAAELQGDETVLEIGAGSGYGAAVLARLCREVYTIERIPQLAEAARTRLALLGYDNVHVLSGDGVLGLSKQGRFGAILVTAAAGEVPPALLEQLADGGRLIIPVGSRSSQQLMKYTRRGAQFDREDLGGFAFVPLVGASE